MKTPRGESQDQHTVMPGMIMVSTASHGGTFLHPNLNSQIPLAFRIRDGWYEEDCATAIPLYFLRFKILDAPNYERPYSRPRKDFFNDDGVSRILISLLKYYPKECIRHFGKSWLDGLDKDQLMLLIEGITDWSKLKDNNIIMEYKTYENKKIVDTIMIKYAEQTA